MKRQVMVGKPEYKCRRCLAIFQGQGEPWEIYRWIAVKEQTTEHHCDDGGRGMADIIGLTPLQEATAISRRHRVSRAFPGTYQTTTYKLTKEEVSLT